MNALQRHIEQLSKDIEPDDDFPKNESSWEELMEFGRLRVAELAVQAREIAELREALEPFAKEAEEWKIDASIMLISPPHSPHWMP